MAINTPRVGLCGLVGRSTPSFRTRHPPDDVPLCGAGQGGGGGGELQSPFYSPTTQRQLTTSCIPLDICPMTTRRALNTTSERRRKINDMPLPAATCERAVIRECLPHPQFSTGPLGGGHPQRTRNSQKPKCVTHEVCVAA